MCGPSLRLDASAINRTGGPIGSADGPIFLQDIVARYARETGAYTSIPSRRKAQEEKEGRRQRPHPIHWNLGGHEPGNLPTMPCNAVRFCHGLDSDKGRSIEQVAKEVLFATICMLVCQVFLCVSTMDIRGPLPCPGISIRRFQADIQPTLATSPVNPSWSVKCAGYDARRRGTLIALRVYFDLSRRME